MPPNETGPAPAAPAPPRRFGCQHLLLAAVVAMVLTAGLCFFAYRFLLRPEPFTPVRLNAQEEQILQGKLDQIGAGLASAASSSEVPAAGGALALDVREHGGRAARGGVHAHLEREAGGVGLHLEADARRGHRELPVEPGKPVDQRSGRHRPTPA